MKETMTLQHDGELSIYLPQQASKGVVLICPGGGYSWLSPREGEPVARRFVEAGWTAAVLTYACYAGQPLGDLPLRQAGEALAVLGARFAGQRIVVCGFSAGGHLAASLGVHWRDAGLPRPDGMILCYPVITAGKYAHQGSIANLAGEGDSAYLVAGKPCVRGYAACIYLAYGHGSDGAGGELASADGTHGCASYSR